MKKKVIRIALSLFTVGFATTAAAVAHADAGETRTVPAESISDKTTKNLPRDSRPSSDYSGTRGGTTPPVMQVPSWQRDRHGQMDHVPPQAIDSDTQRKHVPY